MTIGVLVVLAGAVAGGATGFLYRRLGPRPAAVAAIGGVFLLARLHRWGRRADVLPDVPFWALAAAGVAVGIVLAALVSGPRGRRPGRRR